VVRTAQLSATIPSVTTRVPEFEVLEGDTPFLVRWKNPPDFSEDELLEFIYNNDELEIDGSPELAGFVLDLAPIWN
jgi:hypothetical protein